MADFTVMSIIRHRLLTDGEGVTTLVGLSGCPLKCKYCINERQLHSDKEKFVVCSPIDLAANIMQDYCYFVASGGGVTFGGGESLLHAEAIHEIRKLLPEDVSINVETSLNVPREFLDIVIGDITEFIIDIKDADPNIYCAYTGVSAQKAYDNLKYLAQHNLQDKCKIRIPLIPDFNTKEDLLRTEMFVRSLGFDNTEIFDYVIREQ